MNDHGKDFDFLPGDLCALCVLCGSAFLDCGSAPALVICITAFVARRN
jgi:hypothetical protein